MSVDQVKKRFQQEIKLRAYADQFVDRTEEHEILKAGIELGVNIDSARMALIQVSEAEGYVLESAVRKQIGDLIDTFSGNDGKVDEKEFDDAVSVAMRACKNKKNATYCKRLVIEVMEDGASKVKTGMFSNWYDRTKREVGMA